MADTLENSGEIFQSESISGSKVIVVADGDIILNGFYKQEPLPMGVNPYSMIKEQQVFPLANRSFLQNAVEYLIDENGMIEAKSKDYTLRFLDPVKVQDEKKLWQTLNIVAPILLVILFAVIFQWLRRKKYNSKIIA
jgi:ABC-2 type transport system permease protein